MRCVKVLVLLLFINTCWVSAQEAIDVEEPPQQVATPRRRRVSDLADVEAEEGDVATPEDGEEERLPPPNRANRPRNPNRRRRKRKRIPPPRPLFEDYEDTLAFPASGDRQAENARSPGDEEIDGPEHRAMPGPPPPRRRPLPRDEDDDRPLPRGRPRPPPLDREGQPSVHRPFREYPREYHHQLEDGEFRPQRPLRRRRKNRRRPPLGPPEGPPEGIREDLQENGELPHRREPPLDEPDADDHARHPATERPPQEAEDELYGRGRPLDDIPLGSLHGEVRQPLPPRPRNRPEGDADPEHGATVEGGSVVRRPSTTPESLPAANLPPNNFDNLPPPRQRRRRIRPRIPTSTERAFFPEKEEGKEPEDDVPKKEDDMLGEREPLKQREEIVMVRKHEEDREPLHTDPPKRAEEKDLEAKEPSIVSGDITLQTTPIKISLSDLLREKNISIEEILKDDEPPSPTQRFQRPYKPRPPPPTPKTIVKPTLTQLSRIHQFLNKPAHDKNRQNDLHKKPESNGQNQNNEKTTTTTTTQRSFTHTSTATTRANTPTTNHRKFTPTTPRFQTSTTSRGISTTARTGTTRWADKETGRPTGFGTRPPALNMQETEDIDPVKMTGKSPARPGNSKAAEFLKSRVRLPPSSVLFSKRPGGEQTPSAPDQEPLPTRVVDNVQQPQLKGNATKGTSSAPDVVISSNTESNKIGPIIQNDAVLTNSNIPVYVLNPKYYKASQPKPEIRQQNVEDSPSDTTPLTENVNIAITNKSIVEEIKTTKTIDGKPSSTTESFSDMITDADPLRLNIPLKSGTDQDKVEKDSSRGKSAEDEIVELLETENGSDRLSRILASRNMTLSELIEHRERGASQQHLSDIFLRNEESKVVPNVYTEGPQTEEMSPLNVKNVPKIEDIFTGQNIPTKKMNVEIVEDEDEEENSKRVPRVFDGLLPFKPKTEPVAEFEYKESYPQRNVDITSDFVLETYRPSGKHENPGKVREIVTKISDDKDEFVGLPSGMRSAILASSAVLGLAIFVFLAIFVTCKVRRRQSIRRRYANRSPILSHDVEKSRSMTPVLRHSGYKDMTEERRYYLWNTIRKTLRYK